MGKDQPDSSPSVVKNCPTTLLSSYPVLYPTYTNLSFKNFNSAINFNFDYEQSCKRSWHRDIRSNHIRNKELLHLPLKTPRCCFDAYSANLERRKQKKLQMFNMDTSMRMPSNCEKISEDVKICEDREREVEVEKITYFPECYEFKDDSINEDEEEVYKTCSSGSESECSGCSTLGGGTRKKLHKVVKTDWRKLLHVPENACKDIAKEEIRKHKSRQFFNMKVKKILHN